MLTVTGDTTLKTIRAGGHTVSLSLTGNTLVSQNRTCKIGGHGILFGLTVPQALGLDIVRGLVNAYLIGGIVGNPLDENWLEEHHAAGIAVCPTLRWPADRVTMGNTYDNPPEIDDPDYLAVRDAIADLLNTSAGQAMLLDDLFWIGNGNELGGGPGKIGIPGNLTESNARADRLFAMSTDLVTFLRANVVNGDRIKFLSPVATANDAVDPSYVPETEELAFVQQINRRMIDWAYLNNAYVDRHFLHSGVAIGARPLLPMIQGLFNYAESIGFDLRDRWVSTETSAVQSDTGDLEAAMAQEVLGWDLLFSYRPKFLCRGPIHEGQGLQFTTFALLTLQNVPKQPMFDSFAEVVATSLDAELLQTTIIDGIVGQVLIHGWNNEVDPLLREWDVVRESDTEVTISLPACSDYQIAEPEVVDVTLDVSILAGGGESAETDQFTVTVDLVYIDARSALQSEERSVVFDSAGRGLISERIQV